MEVSSFCVVLKADFEAADKSFQEFCYFVTCGQSRGEDEEARGCEGVGCFLVVRDVAKITARSC